MTISALQMTKAYPQTISCSQLAKAIGCSTFSLRSTQEFLNESFGGDWRKALAFGETQRFFNVVQTRKLIEVLNLQPEDFNK